MPVERVVDATGAGNSYCGAFLAGWIQTGDAVQAARWGAVAGSFAIESTGVIDLDRPGLHAERDMRLLWLEQQMMLAAQRSIRLRNVGQPAVMHGTGAL